jgi:hypothetical protein
MTDWKNSLYRREWTAEVLKSSRWRSLALCSYNNCPSCYRPSYDIVKSVLRFISITWPHYPTLVECRVIQKQSTDSPLNVLWALIDVTHVVVCASCSNVVARNGCIFFSRASAVNLCASDSVDGLFRLACNTISKRLLVRMFFFHSFMSVVVEVSRPWITWFVYVWLLPSAHMQLCRVGSVHCGRLLMKFVCDWRVCVRH